MRRVIESFNHAMEGFIYVLKTQRNMRLHFLLGVLIFISGIILEFTRIELVCLGSIVTLVLFAEMLNTAVEHTIDLISDAFHPLARVIKDICAGAVMVTAISAAICGYLLFSKHIEFSFIGGLSRIKNSPLHISIIAFIIVLSLTMLGKIVSQKGTPMRGGMPSGHSALAFSVWTVIIFSTSNPLIIMLTFFMAVVIATSRLNEGVHGLWEVIAGALLGFLATLLVFQILK